MIAEPWLTGTAWNVSVAPGAFSALENGSLAGPPGIQLSQREGFDVLGTEFRAVLYFGCGLTDFRGMYKNPGA